MITSLKDFIKENSNYLFNNDINLNGINTIPQGYFQANIKYNGKLLVGQNTPYDPSISVFGVRNFQNDMIGNSKIVLSLVPDLFTNQINIENNITFDIKNIIIMKITPGIPFGYDVHFKCDINETEIWGVIKKFGHTTETVICPTIDNSLSALQLKYIHERILTVVRNWSIPKAGLYKPIKDISTYTIKGQEYIIAKNTEVSLPYYNEFGTPCWVIVDDNKYKLKEDDTLMFNILFKEIKTL